MSTQELQQIETVLLKLSLEDLQLFVSDLLKKSVFQKKKINLDQIPTRNATDAEAKAIQQGLDSGLATAEEIEEMENFLKINLR